MARERKAPGVRKRVLRSGTVTYQARWYDARGQRHAATFDSHAEAEEFLVAKRREMRFGGDGDPSSARQEFGDWYSVWLTTRTVRDTTAERDASYARNHILPEWGPVRLADIREADVWSWVADLTNGKGLAPATVKKLLAHFRRSLEDATGPNRPLDHNPASKVKAPPIPLVEARFMDPHEVVRLEEAFDPWWRLVIPFAVDIAPRPGELSALYVRDLDLLAGTVSITETATYAKRKDGGPTRREDATKTLAGRRVVPTLTRETAERLSVMIYERSLGPDDHLFSGPRGGPMDVNNWRARVFNPAVRKAGLAEPFPTPHSLRHTGIAHWLATGADPYSVARWAGHRTTTSLQRLYGHLLPNDAEDEREILSRMRKQAQEAVGLEAAEREVIDLDDRRQRDENR